MGRLEYKLRYVASYLPQGVLGWLSRKHSIRVDPTDGWNFWIDASYEQYCRKDMIRRGTSR